MLLLHSQTNGAIAQLVEQRTENPCVPGSIPGGTTKQNFNTVKFFELHFFFIGRVNPFLNGIFVENNFTTLDKAGFKKVFDKYFDSIRGYIYYRTGDADVASDLAQDIFMKLWEKKERLDDDYIKGLLYKMASDIVISQYRKDVVKTNYRANMRIEGEIVSPQEMAEFEEMKNRINHFIARYLPGSSDNSVFTLLRMMPGVRASNEPSVDLLVWGGPSKVTFDGFTLFGMRGFNDNISFVNPYMVKEITLLKGGYDVSEGGHAGAVAKIIGYSGNNQKAVFKANIGTLTANLYGSIPLSKKGSFSMAYRQTFYHLYSSELLNPFNSNRPSSAGKGAPHIPPGQSKQEVIVYPKYAFRDMNVKFTYGKNASDRFFVSLYGADDKFDFGMVPDDQTEVDASQHSKQLAGATGYERFWSNGSKTRFTMSLSALEDRDENIKISPSGFNIPKDFLFPYYCFMGNIPSVFEQGPSNN